MTVTSSYRYATHDDVSALIDLIERAYRSPSPAGGWASEADLLKGPRTSPSEIAGLIAQPDSRFLIAEHDGRLAGCCLIQRTGATECTSGDIGNGGAYFGMFAIDPAVHATGLGKLILSEAERSARELWNAPAMVMTVINVRDQLIGYYQRRGYRLTGAAMPFPFSETSGEVTRDFHLVELRKDFG